MFKIVGSTAIRVRLLDPRDGRHKADYSTSFLYCSLYRLCIGKGQKVDKKLEKVVPEGWLSHRGTWQFSQSHRVIQGGPGWKVQLVAASRFAARVSFLGTMS